MIPGLLPPIEGGSKLGCPAVHSTELERRTERRKRCRQRKWRKEGHVGVAFPTEIVTAALGNGSIFGADIIKPCLSHWLAPVCAALSLGIARADQVNAFSSDFTPSRRHARRLQVLHNSLPEGPQSHLGLLIRPSTTAGQLSNLICLRACGRQRTGS